MNFLNLRSSYEQELFNYAKKIEDAHALLEQTIDNQSFLQGQKPNVTLTLAKNANAATIDRLKETTIPNAQKLFNDTYKLYKDAAGSLAKSKAFFFTLKKHVPLFIGLIVSCAFGVFTAKGDKGA